MAVPSGALAGAAVSAAALAAIVGDLARTVPVPAATATAVTTSSGRIVRVLAPRVTTRADVAAIAAALVGNVQVLARAASPGDVSAGLYAAAARTSVACPASASPVLTRLYGLARALAASVETACLGEAFLAEARTDFGDRRAATEARDRINRAMDASTDRLALALGQRAVGALSMAARQCSVHLVRLAADLQPVVRVDTPVSVPSTLLAWELYGDPARAPELIRRNRVGTPLFMPTSIEAVAPKA